MSRPVYLVVYHSPLFAAHWALWIPKYANATEGIFGKIIHVEGSARDGFTHEIKRNYDIASTGRTASCVLLCWVDAANIKDPISEIYSSDATATDAIEQCALGIAAPGASLRPAGASGSRSRVELKNCQTWLREVVVALTANDIFPAEALVVLDQAPKN